MMYRGTGERKIVNLPATMQTTGHLKHIFSVPKKKNCHPTTLYPKQHFFKNWDKWFCLLRKTVASRRSLSIGLQTHTKSDIVSKFKRLSNVLMYLKCF